MGWGEGWDRTHHHQMWREDGVTTAWICFDLFLLYAWHGSGVCWVSGMPVTDRQTGIGHLEICI